MGVRASPATNASGKKTPRLPPTLTEIGKPQALDYALLPSSSRRETEWGGRASGLFCAVLFLFELLILQGTLT